MRVEKTRSLIMKTWVKICGAIIISLLLVLSISKIYPTKQIEKDAPLETLTVHFDNRIPELMKAYHIPGVSIALVQEGETVWANAYGYADLETGRKMTTDTYCRVQSISKSITAWGVMNLVQQGDIDLDMPVKHYIKNWEFTPSEFPAENVTVRQLLSHTSGMPLGDVFAIYSPSGPVPSLRESLSQEAVLFQEPGLSFSYSNTGFNLLELMIEEVTGREFAEYMEQDILIPLGMNHSTFVWNEQMDPPIPTGYNLKGQSIPLYVYPEKASGGLFATAEDIATFIIAGMPSFFDEQKVLSEKNINELYSPMAEELGLYSLVFDAYGMGHYIERLDGGQKAISHGGQGTGWMTHFHSVPETGDGIVILTNSQRSWPFIAYVLSDWAQWSGFSSVGMEKIIFGQKVLWVFIGLILFAVIWQLWSLAEGLILKKRRFAPLSIESRFLRLGQCVSFLALTAGLLWCISQPYLDITSIFPLASSWLGISIFVFAIMQLLLALCPKKRNDTKNIVSDIEMVHNN